MACRIRLVQQINNCAELLIHLILRPNQRRLNARSARSVVGAIHHRAVLRLSDLAAAHAIAAIQALVTGSAAHRDAAADIAGGGIGLHIRALLAERINDPNQAKVVA